MEDAGTPAPHRLKFVYPRSFAQFVAYFSALSGLGASALPDAVAVDGLENFVESAGGCGDVHEEEMRDWRLTRALSLLQEFSAGWSTQADVEGQSRGDPDGRSQVGQGRRRPVPVVVGYSVDWRDPHSLERRLEAFCGEVWTLESHGRGKGGGGEGPEVVEQSLQLNRRVETSLLSMEFRLSKSKGTPVYFPVCLSMRRPCNANQWK